MTGAALRAGCPGHGRLTRVPPASPLPDVPPSGRGLFSSGQWWLGYPDHGLLDASSMSVPPGCENVGHSGNFRNLLAAGIV